MTISFNGMTKQILISNETSIEIIEIYSAWKDWINTNDNAKYLQAFRTFGGDPTSSGQSAPKYFFLLNSWQIVCNELDILFDGNLYAEDTDSPFVNINSNITHKTSDAATVNISGSSGGLTTEEHNKLMKTLEKNQYIALK